jgi:hypothetical protein
MPIKEVLIPKMTTAERSAIVSPTTGLLIFNSTTNTFETWNGTAWVGISAGAGGPVVIASGGTLGGFIENSVICQGNVTITSNTTIRGNLLVMGNIINQSNSYSLTVHGTLFCQGSNVYFNPVGSPPAVYNGAYLTVYGDCYIPNFNARGATHTTGGACGNGGQIYVQGNLLVISASLCDLRGGDGDASASVPGNGGQVSVVGCIQTSSNNGGFLLTGGQGYNVNGGLGGVFIAGAASGGFGVQTNGGSCDFSSTSGDGGNAGSYTIKGPANIGSISCAGGRGGTLTGSGGNGGNVNLAGPSAVNTILTMGGGGSGTRCGNAGNITLMGDASVYSDILANGGSIPFNPANPTNTISGAGGTIASYGKLTMGSGSINNSGGNRNTYSLSAVAGSAGNITLKSGSLNNIYSNGGNNDATSQCGNPGTIYLEDTTVKESLQMLHGTTGLIPTMAFTLNMGGKVLIGALDVSNVGNGTINLLTSSCLFKANRILKLNRLTNPSGGGLTGVITPADICCSVNNVWYKYTGVVA